MRRAILSLAAFVALAAPAGAEPRAAHPQPTPSAVGVPFDLTAPDDPARAAAKAKQDAFDKHIATRSERAMRSICLGCESGPARARPAASRHNEAKAAPVDEPGDDFVVDEPAEAPAN